MTPGARWRWWALQALMLRALGRKANALQCTKKILCLQPTNKHALASQAHAQAEQLDFSGAVATLELLTSAWPQDAPGWFNLGYVFQQVSCHTKAEPAFRSALVLNPLMDTAWYGLALTLMHKRQFYDAAQALKTHTTLQPMSAHGWYRLAEVCMALDQRDEAQKVFDHLSTFEPAVARQLERQYQSSFAFSKVFYGVH